MRIFKNKAFTKWAAKEGIGDDTLRIAVDEMEQGLIGAHVVKKRVAVGGRGKSGGVRTLVVYKLGQKAFFVYGFAKNARANISTDELKVLKHLAKELLSYSNKSLIEAMKHGVLNEVDNDG